jgi:hypothetical protein
MHNHLVLKDKSIVHNCWRSVTYLLKRYTTNKYIPSAMQAVTVSVFPWVLLISRKKYCRITFEGVSLLQPTRLQWYHMHFFDIIGKKVILLATKSYSESWLEELMISKRLQDRKLNVKFCMKHKITTLFCKWFWNEFYGTKNMCKT